MFGIDKDQLLAAIAQAYHNGTSGKNDKSNVDYDIIKGKSVAGGARSPEKGIFGKTKTLKSYAPTTTVNTKEILPITGDETGATTSEILGVSTNLADGTEDPDAAVRAQLRDEIKGRGGEIEAIYNALFGDVDSLLKSRDAELESQYGEQSKKATDQYMAALPEIENSYAAIGSGDSTDNSDAKDKAKFGHDDTQKTIGKNKEADKAKLGQYGNEQRAKISADKDAATRNVARADETEDVGALRQMRNDLETNISNAGVTRATLGTDGKARQDLSALTGDAGRFDAATNALDSVIKSSMSGAVKEAAVKAVVDNAGLSEDEKKKITAQYGNVYAEQAAL